VLTVPLIVGDQLIGLLGLDRGSEHAYSPEEIALAKAVAKLSALVIERQRLIEERARAQAGELAQREANRRMDAFLGIVSHELRTPLTAINTNTQLAARRLRKQLKQGLTDSATLEERLSSTVELLERASHQVDVLNRVVGDLLDISRIQAGQLELHIKQDPCDLVAIVREAVENQRVTSPKRKLHLELPAQDEISIFADAGRIGQVVTNYLTNALKYSPEYEPVEVRVLLDEAERVARVLVRDRGPGLPLAEQERIWERFYRVKGIEVQSGSGVGLGLGLHICHTIITRHAGDIGVQSAPGEGATFWFSLRLA
jgi:signal transduction histidine kinase